MRGKKLKFIVSVVALLLVFVVAFYLLLQNRNQADELASVTYQGKVHLGSISGSAAAGANVLLQTDSDLCKVKSYSTTANANGDFQIIINQPICSCPYKVIAGGNADYNAVDNGGVTIPRKTNAPGSTGFFNAQLRTNKTTQAMHSAYFGSVYTEGYNGYFHLSQWDTHFMRNKVSMGQLLNPSAPGHANFTLAIDRFNPVMGRMMPGAPDYVIGVKLSAFAVADDSWAQTYSSPTITGALDIKQISLNTTTGQISGDLNFSVDFSNLTLQQRYGVWLNGFMIGFQFDSTDTTVLERWRNTNPDILLPLNGPGINYSDFKEYKPSSSQLNVTSDPVPSKSITCDYGYRQIGQGCHDGIDLSAGNGTPVKSISDGIVESVSNINGYGLCITMKHCGNMESRYCHMGSAAVKAGDYVSGGDTIGSSDTSGTQSAHLHFMVMKDGTPYDPWNWFRGYSQTPQHLCSNKGSTEAQRKNNLEGSCVTSRGWEIGY